MRSRNCALKWVVPVYGPWHSHYSIYLFCTLDIAAVGKYLTFFIMTWCYYEIRTYHLIDDERMRYVLSHDRGLSSNTFYRYLLSYPSLKRIKKKRKTFWKTIDTCSIEFLLQRFTSTILQLSISQIWYNSFCLFPNIFTKDLDFETLLSNHSLTCSIVYKCRHSPYYQSGNNWHSIFMFFFVDIITLTPSFSTIK